MNTSHRIEDTVRDTIIASPDILLDDKDLMQALIAANERSMGGNIVDLRGIAMERLEARLDRLEDTHRSVIAAAYENLAGTNQVHRAILRMLDPTAFGTFLRDLDGPVADILGVAAIRLVLESTEADDGSLTGRLGPVLSMAEPGYVARHIGGEPGAPLRPVTLRQVHEGHAPLYGDTAAWVRSEACLALDLGEGRQPGMLLMGAEDPHRFTPQQGTDLLAFFGGIFERTMRRWLS